VKDDQGNDCRKGDTICFSYGIPPVHVEAKLRIIAGELYAMTPGHNPPCIRLRALRSAVGGWLKKGGTP
jgi:hypothetical protein